MLKLTAADVERAIYKAKGIDFEDIVATLESTQPAGLDIKALKIELKANNFYRGNPYIDAVGTILGLTTEQLDEFFETNDYTKLLPPEEENETSSLGGAETSLGNNLGGTPQAETNTPQDLGG